MLNIQEMFAPKKTDVPYVQGDQLKISLILRVDSYKFAHPFVYRPGIKAMTSYGEARVSPKQTIVSFGRQIFIKRYLSQTLTMKDVNDAEAFALAHFGRPLFDRKAFEKVVNVYKGKLPLIIRGVKEGTTVKGGMPLYTVTCFDEDCYWMSAGFETMIQRAEWYPTTIATRDYETKNAIAELYEQTGADMNLLPFALHDFAGRGVTCAEQAEIGGAAHLVNFMGSDTVEGILTANFYYKKDMAAFSVFATEHAVQCTWGPNHQKEYIQAVLKNALPGTIVSIVLDGYDLEREVKLCCKELRDEIIATQAKVVFRPDSGDMMVNVPMILKLQEEAFGYTMTSKGYKTIKNVGIIQGDGVTRETLLGMLRYIIDLGYSADCMIFGSGGDLLQKVNRDTFKFAQKACAILIDGKWVGVAKDPVTDPGKKSKEGVLTLVRSRTTGEMITARLDTLEQLDSEWEDMHELMYHCGTLYNETTLDEVRVRVSA